MEKITINASRTYDVLTAPGLISKSGELIRQALGDKAKKLCIVTDNNVSALYRQPVKDSLLASGFDVVSFVFPHGEANKSMATVSGLLEFLAQHQLTRSDALVALGGGITGDLTGYGAASYLRGIQFIQIPTTLLAAVDSSVGGKTGVNLKAGKNLAGAFWQPSLVLFDTNTMKTLSRDLLMDGVAEAIKAGVIADRDLLDYITDAEDPTAPEFIATLSSRAIAVKQTVVEADERDTGVRQLLNLGHTIGHAIEKCSNFQISHGHAVAMGMVIIAKACDKQGWSQDDCLTPILKALNKFDFPLDHPYTAPQLAQAALNDKKRSGDTITLIVPVKPGDCKPISIPVEELESFIQGGLE